MKYLIVFFLFLNFSYADLATNWNNPAEMDAWRMGDTVQKNLTNSKKGK